GEPDAQVVRVEQLGVALQIFDLAKLHQLAGAVGQPLDDVVLEGAQLVEIDLRLGELDAPRCRMTRFVDHLGDVEQRLRGNAAAIDAHAAGIQLGIDERGAETEIGGEERGGVSTGTAADDNELSRDHTKPGRSGRPGRPGRSEEPSAGSVTIRPTRPTWLTRLTWPRRVTPAATVRTDLRAPARPSAGSGCRRRRRSRDGRRTATAAASAAARTGRCPSDTAVPSARARCRGSPLPAH